MAHPGSIHRYFVAVQMPITDLRAVALSGLKLPAPAWPDPVEGEEFMRGIGVVKARPRGGLHYWTGDRAYVDAARLLRPTHVEPGPPRGTLAYCRLFGGRLGYRMDIGMVFRTADDVSVRALAQRALRWRLERDGELGNSGSALASSLLARSSPTNANLSRQAPLVRAASPMVLVEYPVKKLTVDSQFEVDAIMQGPRRVPVYAIPSAPHRYDASLRGIRGAVWRLHAELETLRAFRRHFYAHPEDFDAPKALAYLGEMTRNLARRRRSGVNMPPLVALAESVEGFDRSEIADWSRELAYDAKIISDQLAAMLRDSQRAAIFAAGSKASIYDLTREELLVSSPNAPQNFVFHGPVTGVVGSQGSVTGNQFNAITPWSESEWRDVIQRIAAANAQGAPAVADWIPQLEAARPEDRRGLLERMSASLAKIGAVAGPVLDVINKTLDIANKAT